MKKLFIGVYNPSIILTYLGVFCAVVGLSLVLCIPTTGFSRTTDVVMILLMAAGVCDMFDGAVARRVKRTEKEKEFGIQLDSLADTVSFVAFPASILLSVSGLCPLHVVIACLYVFGGIMRLGWFNVTTEENKGIYKGLPVTCSAIIFPLFYFILRLLNVEQMTTIYPIVFACVGILFIVNFQFKKPKLKYLLPLVGLAIIGTAVLLLRWL